MLIILKGIDNVLNLMTIWNIVLLTLVRLDLFYVAILIAETGYLY